MNIFYIRSILFLILCNTSSIFSQKILLTGGAGFIGSHVAQALLKRGDSVIVIDNFNDAYDIAIKKYNLSQVKEYAANGQLTVYAIDICDEEKMKDIFE